MGAASFGVGNELAPDSTRMTQFALPDPAHQRQDDQATNTGWRARAPGRQPLAGVEEL